MPLLTALIVQNSHILAGIYFIFLKKRPRPNLKGFNIKFWPLWKDRKISYQNCHANQVWRLLGRVRGKKLFPETKYLTQTLVFMWNSTLREKHQFLFFRRFLLVLTKFWFWGGDWALGYNCEVLRVLQYFLIS